MFRTVPKHVPYDVVVKAQNKIVDELFKIYPEDVVEVSSEIDINTGSAFIHVGVVNKTVQISSPLLYVDETGANYRIQIKQEVIGRIVAINDCKAT